MPILTRGRERPEVMARLRDHGIQSIQGKHKHADAAL